MVLIACARSTCGFDGDFQVGYLEDRYSKLLSPAMDANVCKAVSALVTSDPKCEISDVHLLVTVYKGANFGVDGVPALLAGALTPGSGLLAGPSTASSSSSAGAGRAAQPPLPLAPPPQPTTTVPTVAVSVLAVQLEDTMCKYTPCPPWFHHHEHDGTPSPLSAAEAEGSVCQSWAEWLQPYVQGVAWG